jgi:hypothetical protein
MFLVLPLLLVSVVIPFVILMSAIKERRTPGTIAAAVALSVVMTIASDYAILPLVM